MVKRALEAKRQTALVGVVLLCGLIAFGAFLRLQSTRPLSGQGPISVSVTHCGEGWTHPRGGTQTLWLQNTSSAGAEADLIDPRTGAVYAEVENMGPGTTRPLPVTLGDGTFAVRCLAEDMDAVLGPTVQITGSRARSGPAVVPVTVSDLLSPLRLYHAYVQSGLDELVGETDSLQAAALAGDLDAARSKWLTAHLTYERLGAAYDAFGDFDGRINGRPDGSSLGVRDPSFTGFHRLEYGLWHGQPAAGLAPVAAGLDQDVRGLDRAWPGMEVDPTDLGLRAHEIMENALQFELSGETEEGSGSNLATALANLQGTREVLDTLRPLLQARYRGLSALDSILDRVQTLLLAEQPNGAWTPVESLTTQPREQLDGAVGQLLEQLAPVAAICEARRTV